MRIASIADQDLPTRVDSDLLVRIRMEYTEMPGLRLTTRQARRFWNLDSSTCDELLESLVREQFLAQSRDGSYLRRQVSIG